MEQENLNNQEPAQLGIGVVMPSLPLDVIDFIGRCNLYRENGKWYDEDGLFANSDVSLLQYIIELNQNMDALGNEA